ncbi:MAG: DNA (cytosine-5-)-methyltransferase [Ignavibacteria bacterium]|nr:DNA (cytosine-5-)-methyltransferase [Ignavibacteria bacterium]
MQNEKLTVLDLFCGAGGFSEGFRQQGFEIIMGIDHWKPAIDTFNKNFDLNCQIRNIKDFSSYLEIENLPDTDVIVGSPPCVSFSSSNRSGKADKTEGILLTKIFLKIIALKKHKPGSILKAWFMENVLNSQKHLKEFYTFNDLYLTSWAKKNNIDPNNIAINLKGNNAVINSADYGAPQRRKRLITGEIIKLNKFVIPSKTHSIVNNKENLPEHITIGFIKNTLPKPNEKESKREIIDPVYGFSITMDKLTDHFYDTGIHKHDWEMSKRLKTNHPYMGRMSFPENMDAPSRTVTATKIGSSREALIYLSEYNREGNGKYRTATVREAAVFMGFPITYQFIGNENPKWRLVGNAVSPNVSRALAKEVRRALGLESICNPQIKVDQDINQIVNLNTFKEKVFQKFFKKKKGCRFRGHIIKEGNMTVTLSNYDISKKTNLKKWFTSVQYGTGEGFPTHNYPDHFYLKLEETIINFKNGDKFLDMINNGFSDKIAPSNLMQYMYENQRNINNFLEPTALIEEASKIILHLKNDKLNYKQGNLKIFKKNIVPIKQILALYAINKICTITNKQ